MPSPDVLVSSPFPIESSQGNSVSARRIARRLVTPGRQVEARHGYSGEDAAVLIALHARRSLQSIIAFKTAHPQRPVILVLTGTDLYKDLPAGDPAPLEAMAAADALVLYQDASTTDVPERYRDKLHTIWKSIDLAIPTPRPSPPDHQFRFTILAHLRPIKDPFLPAAALAQCPSAPAIQIDHYGDVLDKSLAMEASQWMRREPRYHWRQALPRDEVAATICSSHATINSGLAEGGSNAICESIVLGTPVIATHTPANVGFLGKDYLGYYPPRDAGQLALLLGQCCRTDSHLLESLTHQIAKRAPLFLPESEALGWNQLLDQLQGIAR